MQRLRGVNDRAEQKIHGQHHADVQNSDEESYEQAESIGSVVIQRIQAGAVVKRTLGDANDVDSPVPDERYASAEPGNLGRLKGNFLRKKSRLVRSEAVPEKREKHEARPADRSGHDRTGRDVFPASGGVDAVPRIARWKAMVCFQSRGKEAVSAD